MYKLINMSGVSQCSIGDCAYNADQACHAIAITVGDGDKPMCDTFFKAAERSSVHGSAGVGACKVSACQHNRGFECSAGSILVGNQANQSSCLTFAAM